MAGAWRGGQGVSGRLEGGRVPAQGARSMMCIPCYPRDLLGGAHRPRSENFFVTRDDMGVAQHPRRGPALLLVGLRQLLSPATPCDALRSHAEHC